jgi:cobalt-zinc-cadmium efflux system outer membrane protein
MHFERIVLVTGIVLSFAVVSCSSYSANRSRREPGPLGHETTAYRPLIKPVSVRSELSDFDEPSGAITLRTALSFALINNPELAAFSREIRAGEARTLQAGLRPNPEVEIEIEEFGGSGELSGFDAAATTIQLSQLVELGGKRAKRTRLAALGRDIAGWDYEAKRFDVSTDVTKAFVDVLAAQERLDLGEQLLSLSKQVFDTVSEKVKAGKVSPLEETKAKVELSMTRIELERARRELQVARKQLAATWGSASPTFEGVIGEFDVTLPISTSEQLTDRISQNPDIARWVAEMEQRRAAVELEESNAIPDFALSAGVQRFEETEEEAFILGFSVPLPLFDRNQGGILEAQHTLARALEERRAEEIRILTELEEAYQKLLSAQMEATVLRNEVLPGAQSAFEAAREGYRRGKFDYLTVLDAQRTLFEAKGQYIEVLAAYRKAVTDVERLIGQPIDTAGATEAIPLEESNEE